MTRSMDGDAVERLYLRLVEALQARGGVNGAVTVAEIYQELVPYRSVRGDVGFGMNADYEHALLRLLAGDGGFVRLDPPKAVQELRRELDSANPNLGMYREFAGCDAFITPPEAGFTAEPVADEDLPWLDDGSADDGDDAPAPARADDWGALAALAADGADEDAAADVAVSTFAFVDAEPAPAMASAAPVTDPPAATPKPQAESARCAFCDSSLPRHRPVRYCPFCGADQSARPCGECGETVEPGWTFCVACGARGE